MMELFQFGFMRRAIAAGMIVGALCPLIGIFLVLRRMSLIGDSLSHVALAGVAAGIVSGVYPPAAALVFSVAAALGIEQLGKKYPEHAELAIAVILSAGIGTAVVLVSYAKSINIDLFGYLFGNILTVGPGDMWLIAALGSFILVFVGIYFRELFFIAFDEEGARIAGIPVKKNKPFVYYTCCHDHNAVNENSGSPPGVLPYGYTGCRRYTNRKEFQACSSNVGRFCANIGGAWNSFLVSLGACLRGNHSTAVGCPANAGPGL